MLPALASVIWFSIAAGMSTVTGELQQFGVGDVLRREVHHRARPVLMRDHRLRVTARPGCRCRLWSRRRQRLSAPAVPGPGCGQIARRCRSPGRARGPFRSIPSTFAASRTQYIPPARWRHNDPEAAQRDRLAGDDAGNVVPRITEYSSIIQAMNLRRGVGVEGRNVHLSARMRPTWRM